MNDIDHKSIGAAESEPGDERISADLR